MLGQSIKPSIGFINCELAFAHVCLAASLSDLALVIAGVTPSGMTGNTADLRRQKELCLWCTQLDSQTITFRVLNTSLNISSVLLTDPKHNTGESSFRLPLHILPTTTPRYLLLYFCISKVLSINFASSYLSSPQRRKSSTPSTVSVLPKSLSGPRIITGMTHWKYCTAIDFTLEHFFSRAPPKSTENKHPLLFPSLCQQRDR